MGLKMGVSLKTIHRTATQCIVDSKEKRAGVKSQLGMTGVM